MDTLTKTMPGLSEFLEKSAQGYATTRGPTGNIVHDTRTNPELAQFPVPTTGPSYSRENDPLLKEKSAQGYATTRGATRNIVHDTRTNPELAQFPVPTTGPSYSRENDPLLKEIRNTSELKGLTNPIFWNNLLVDHKNQIIPGATMGPLEPVTTRQETNFFTIPSYVPEWQPGITPTIGTVPPAYQMKSPNPPATPTPQVTSPAAPATPTPQVTSPAAPATPTPQVTSPAAPATPPSPFIGPTQDPGEQSAPGQLPVPTTGPSYYRDNDPLLKEILDTSELKGLTNPIFWNNLWVDHKNQIIPGAIGLGVGGLGLLGAGALGSKMGVGAAGGIAGGLGLLGLGLGGAAMYGAHKMGGWGNLIDALRPGGRLQQVISRVPALMKAQDNMNNAYKTLGITPPASAYSNSSEALDDGLRLSGPALEYLSGDPRNAKGIVATQQKFNDNEGLKLLVDGYNKLTGAGNQTPAEQLNKVFEPGNERLRDAVLSGDATSGKLINTQVQRGIDDFKNKYRSSVPEWLKNDGLEFGVRRVGRDLSRAAGIGADTVDAVHDGSAALLRKLKAFAKG
jgi:hypothetical protein